MKKDKTGKVRKDLNCAIFLMSVLKFSYSQAQGNCSFLIPHPFRLVHGTKTGLAESL